MNSHDGPMIYIGCIGVNKSMKTLSHHARSDVAKESIQRLCEANGIKRNFDKKRGDTIDHMLDKEPNLSHSGTEVELSVTSTHFNVITRETKEIIVAHEIPNVSFASSGGPETVDFVGYVANDKKYGRACFVLKCGVETAKELLQTIARGFHLRTQQILNTKSSSPLYPEQFSGFIGHNQSRSDPWSVNNSPRINNENHQNEEVISMTRKSLENELWFHGSYLSREESEKRLKNDGDFLVRESFLDQGQFVLSVMNDGVKLHLLFDSMGKVKTKDTEFNDISHLVRFHLEKGQPIVANNMHLYLRNGVRPPARAKLA